MREMIGISCKKYQDGKNLPSQGNCWYFLNGIPIVRYRHKVEQQDSRKFRDQPGLDLYGEALRAEEGNGMFGRRAEANVLADLASVCPPGKLPDMGRFFHFLYQKNFRRNL